MSKRKRASLGKIPATPPSGPEADESTDDAAVKENMVHVTPDLLAGSPDIFASKKSASGAEPEAVTEPIEEPAQAEAEPTEASTTLTPTEEAPPFSTESHSAPQPTFVAATPYPAQPRRGGSSTALGIVLVVIGLFALAVVLSGVDLTHNGWPLFVSLMIFLIGFVVFESILGISGRDYFGPAGKAALPVLLILVGIILLVRSVQRSRRT